MKKNIVILSVLAVICFYFFGCGSTFRGASQDVQRMGKGIKTIFVAE